MVLVVQNQKKFKVCFMSGSCNSQISALRQAVYCYSCPPPPHQLVTLPSKTLSNEGPGLSLRHPAAMKHKSTLMLMLSMSNTRSSDVNMFLPALSQYSFCYDFPDSKPTAHHACRRLYGHMNTIPIEKTIYGQGFMLLCIE